MKQEITRFSDFSRWEFNLSVIQFSRVPYFLQNLPLKFNRFEADTTQTLINIFDALLEQRQLHFAEWEPNYISKDTIIDNKLFYLDGYIPELTLVFQHHINLGKQYILPFFLNEGDVKLQIS